MPTIEELLDCDYRLLKQHILNKEPFMIDALKDYRIKKKLIDSESKYELIWLVQEISDEYAKFLFDNEGIEILSRTADLEYKITGIITSGNDYVNGMLKNKKFCSLLEDNFECLKNCLFAINPEGALDFITYIKENNRVKLTSVLLSLTVQTQKEVIKKIEIPSEILKFCTVALSKESSEYLINNDIRITSLNNYNFDELFSIFSKGYHIQSSLLENHEFLKKISSMNSVKDYRFLINQLSQYNSIELIEKKRKAYYDFELLSFDKDSMMLKRHNVCYSELCELMTKKEIDSDKIDKIIGKNFNFFGSNISELELKKILYSYITKNDKEGLRQFLISESNIQISNIIVDYHFEDIPYNFFLDIKQLCNFQESEGRTLSDDDLNIYTLLLNIDLLSYEEKMFLHKRLLKDDWISKHYDIFRKAKDKAAGLIKEQMLNSETIKDYYNRQLSDENGVPIYVLDGQEFLALVKSLNCCKNLPLTENRIVFNVDGSSFSLDGSNKLNTYRDPHTYYNLIYSDFPINQVIHMYPVDSYSRYDRNDSEKATPRVYELYTPQQFVDKSLDYNEIVIAQRNNRNMNNELNANLKLPTLMGIYCYDEIARIDIESAKNLGIGIVAVKTKSYDIKKEGRLAMVETIAMPFDKRYTQNIDYLTNVNSSDMVNRRTK